MINHKGIRFEIHGRKVWFVSLSLNWFNLNSSETKCTWLVIIPYKSVDFNSTYQTLFLSLKGTVIEHRTGNYFDRERQNLTWSVDKKCKKHRSVPVFKSSICQYLFSLFADIRMSYSKSSHKLSISCRFNFTFNEWLRPRALLKELCG